MLIVRLDKAHSNRIGPIAAALGQMGEVPRQIHLGDHLFLLTSGKNGNDELLQQLRNSPYVADVVVVDTPFVLSSRKAVDGRTAIKINGHLVIGGREFVVMAGPCAVESREKLKSVADDVKRSGARILRGGAYKPRTSPFSFLGLGGAGLPVLKDVGKETGLPVISEVMEPACLEEVTQAVDILQVGMRNALNYPLLREIGKMPGRPPVLLKCGIGTTLKEFLCAADYILSGGNPNVILCLRGSMGMSNGDRAVLSLGDIPSLRNSTHLPVIVDPSHAAGRWELVPAMAAGAMAAGADGLLVEVHQEPEAALSDGRQSLKPDRFSAMMNRLRRLAPVLGRKMAPGEGLTLNEPMEELLLEPPETSDEPHSEDAKFHGT